MQKRFQGHRVRNQATSQLTSGTETAFKYMVFIFLHIICEIVSRGEQWASPTGLKHFSPHPIDKSAVFLMSFVIFTLEITVT